MGLAIEQGAGLSAGGEARLPGRLVSLDAFRGATIAGMILVNNLGDHSNAYAPLLHAPWHGWTMTDLVFPFFLWIMGVAMTFSFASRLERGAAPSSLLNHIARRAGLLFALGLFLNAFPHFDLANLRYMGVLQRIALCYLFGSLIYLWSGFRGRVLWSAGLLALYWALMKLYPVPGYGAGVLELPGNFAQYVDSLVLKGHLYRNQLLWDPEGLVSTLTAVTNTLFGTLCGSILREGEERGEKLRSMVFWGAGLVALGLLADRWLPVNKNLWTSSYAMFTSGLAFLAFAACWWAIDVRGWRGWAWPFVVFGRNAIAVYTASGMLARVMSLTGWKAAVHGGWLLPALSAKNASAAYGLLNVAVLFGLAWLLHWRRWYVRL